jgi:hypothetical protein
VVVGLGLGDRVVVEGVVLRHLVDARPDVGHHHVAPHPGGLRGLHGADRGVAVDGIRALLAPSARAGRPHDRVVVPGEVGQRLDVHGLHVGDDRLGAHGAHVVGVVGVADDGVDLVAAGDQQGSGEQCDLAVAADQQDA